MINERRQILDMLSQGKITAEEADRLLRATDDTVIDRPAPSFSRPSRNRIAPSICAWWSTPMSMASRSRSMCGCPWPCSMRG